MAGYTSRILFTSVSSLFAVLTLLWYSRKKKSVSPSKVVEQDLPRSDIPKITSTEEVVVCADQISMNLIEDQPETHLAQQSICQLEISPLDKMHLKDKTEDSDDFGNTVVTDTVPVELNGKLPNKICNGNLKLGNGTTCETVAKAQGIVTNGTAHSKYDKALDKEDSSVHSGCEEDRNGFKKTSECDNTSELTNGIKSLNLSRDINSEQKMLNGGEDSLTKSIASEENLKNGNSFNKDIVVTQTLCNGNGNLDKDILADQHTNGESHAEQNISSQSTMQNGKSDLESLDCSEETVCTMKNMSTDNFTELPSQMPSFITNIHDNTGELSCETNFERKTLTPDSGVSAELQECDSSSSTMSDHSSECILNGVHSEVLKSPVLSESSNDSGKDCRENHFEIEGAAASTDANGMLYPQPCEDQLKVYEFEIPQNLCGYLIGKNGRHVKYIYEETNAHIAINNHPVFNQLKVCSIAADTDEDLQHTLVLIRKKFPLDKHPQLTLEAINPQQTECTLPITVRLSLPEGITFDAVLSSTINAGHIFLQQPTHPTYHTLSWLSETMTSWYNQYETPKLFRISPGNVVAAPMCGGWYRAEVTELFTETEECVVKFLDFGGYCKMLTDSLRQMRIEFSYVPFQSVECYLGNVMYPKDSNGWSDEAKRVFEELGQGQILQGYIVGYEGEVPYVHLYRVQGASTVFINRELVNRGLARWMELEQQQQQH